MNRTLLALCILLSASFAHAGLPPTQACIGVSNDAPVCETGIRRGWYFDKRTMDMHLVVRGVDALELDWDGTNLNMTSPDGTLVFGEGIGDLTLSGGAGALVFPDGDETISILDNDAEALVIESSDGTDLLSFVTSNGGEYVDADVAITSPIVATHLGAIRFCGNGPDGATTTYLSPVPMFGAANYEFGGSGCDGEDSTTETTADEVFTGLAFKPVAMACVAKCTGATAADDAVVFQLRDDTSDVSGATCTTAALGGDATPAQCVFREPDPQTVASESAIAVAVTMTDDDCNDAGDDFECMVYVTY